MHMRRGWDSNPRGLATWRFSRALVSTTHAPLHRLCTTIASVARCYYEVMEVFISDRVIRFIASLDRSGQSDIYDLIELLREYGHQLSMPFAKPVGNKLWELRHTGSPQARILYGFCEGKAVLLLGIKKQRAALRPQDLALAKRRLDVYCGL